MATTTSPPMTPPAPATTPPSLSLLTVVVKVKMFSKRASGVFQGENGLILTGALAGLGTLFCLFVFLLIVIHVRKRIKRRKKASPLPGQSTFNKIKARVSSEAGHHVLRSETSHAQHSDADLSPSTLQTLFITDLSSNSSNNKQQYPQQPGYPGMYQTPASGSMFSHQSQWQPQPTATATATAFAAGSAYSHSTAIPQTPLQSGSAESKIRKSTIPFSEPPARRRREQQQEQPPFQSSLLPLQYDEKKTFSSQHDGIGHGFGQGRPPSFLPYPRGLTPLSIPISSSSSPSEVSGSAHGRPGLSAVPSSELLHSSTENEINLQNQYENEYIDDDAESIVQEARAPSVTPSSEAGTPRPRRRSKTSMSGTNMQRPSYLYPQPTSAPAAPPPAAAGTSIDAQSAKARMLNFSYPVVAMAAHVHHTQTNLQHQQQQKQQHSRPTFQQQHLRDDAGSTHTLQHIRNRSNGTVMTYASSFSNLSNTTARIQPVVFNDSPRLSISVNLYQPSMPYASQKGASSSSIRNPPSQGGAGSRNTHHRSTSDKQSDRETLNSLRSQQSPPASAGSTTHNFKFPTPPRVRKASDSGSSAYTSTGIAVAGNNQQSSSTTARPQEQRIVKKANRRASGKLPDMLFSRTPSHEEPPSPSTPSDKEDLSNMLEDESILDPMEEAMRRQTFQDMRFSTSTIASVDGTIDALKEFKRDARPPLEHSNPSTTSLMTSTSSTATSSSNYGVAV